MSSTIKFGLLALVSTAAAVPHYGHNRHHRRVAKGTGSLALPAYPTGGFNATAAPYPTAGGTGSPEPEPTTTTINISYLTETIVSTIYATRTGAAGVPAPSNALPLDVTSAAVCVPETIKVTATEKVYVTVPAAGPSGTTSSLLEIPSEVPATSQVQIPSEVPATSQVQIPSEVPATSQVQTSSKVAATPEVPIPSQYPTSVVYSAAVPSQIVPEPSTSEVAVTTEAPAPTTSAVVEAVSSAVALPTASYVSKPVSSGGASYSGSKRGLAYNDVNLCSSFSGDKIGFAYNWAQAENGALPDGIQFIPMMHKPSDSTAEAFLANVDAAVEKGTTAVMTFNEPDHAAQANMSPEAACDTWSSYIQPIVSSHPNVEIMSPSVTNGPAPMGLDWLSRFQKNCPGATWHSANIHFYDIYDDQTFDRFKAHVELAVSTFNTPVWITEFGLNPGSATPEQAADFLGKAVTYLDGNADVKGYAWFMVGTDTSFNMLNSGTGLSTTGQIYASS